MKNPFFLMPGSAGKPWRALWGRGRAVAGLALAGGRLAAADPDTVAALIRAGEYQLAHPSPKGESADTHLWVQGAFLAGLSAFDRSGVAGSPFDAALRAIGERNRWQLGSRVYHADDMCVGQTYLDLYDAHRDPRMLRAMQERCDQILAHPRDGDLSFTVPDKLDRWSWCDALFMAPAGWAHLSALTGNPAYREYAVAHWRMTSDFLYDRSEHLFYRDSSFFAKREPNGRKVFWSRGNGWVIAGLARFLDHLPPDHPARPALVRQFREMAERLRQLQRPNGAWTTSLLDPEDCRPDGEASGTGFHSFAFAWGVNRRLLDPVAFGGAARRGFSFLRTCEEPTGRLNHVQPIGSKPQDFPPEGTEAYGYGGFLLTGSELLRSAGGALP